jgi:hypothetical protein
VRTTPLSTFQADYWQRDRARPGASAIILRAFDVDGPVDVADQRRRLAGVVGRHDSLRTRFDAVDGEPRQVVEDDVPVEIRVADLTALPPDERAEEVRRRERAERAEPLDLGTAPLWRVTLLRCAEDAHVLLVAVHHIVCDGWSVSLLAAELCGGSPATSRYADFVAWERTETADRLPTAVAYWKPRLGALPAPLALPVHRPRDVVRAYRSERVAFAWPLADRLREVARAKRASPFMVLLTAFASALHAVTGDRDLAIASLFAGRDRAEFETMIGLLARTTVFRLDLSGEPTRDELLSRVRGAVFDAHEHAGVPLRTVAQEIFGEPEAGRTLTRLWDVWFNLLPAPAEIAGLPGARVLPRAPASDLAVEKDERDWEGENVTVTITDLRPDLRGHLDVNALLISRETAESLVAAFRRALDDLLDAAP